MRIIKISYMKFVWTNQGLIMVGIRSIFLGKVNSAHFPFHHVISDVRHYQTLGSCPVTRGSCCKFRGPFWAYDNNQKSVTF